MDSHERYQHATEYRDRAERFSRRGPLLRDPDPRRADPVAGFGPNPEGFDAIRMRRILDGSPHRNPRPRTDDERMRDIIDEIWRNA
jgi:hypothetical protein